VQVCLPWSLVIISNHALYIQRKDFEGSVRTMKLQVIGADCEHSPALKVQADTGYFNRDLVSCISMRVLLSRAPYRERMNQ
jgi:hypothetical protein